MHEISFSYPDPLSKFTDRFYLYFISQIIVNLYVLCYTHSFIRKSLPDEIASSLKVRRPVLKTGVIMDIQNNI